MVAVAVAISFTPDTLLSTLLGCACKVERQLPECPERGLPEPVQPPPIDHRHQVPSLRRQHSAVERLRPTARRVRLQHRTSSPPLGLQLSYKCKHWSSWISERLPEGDRENPPYKESAHFAEGQAPSRRQGWREGN